MTRHLADDRVAFDEMQIDSNMLDRLPDLCPVREVSVQAISVLDQDRADATIAGEKLKHFPEPLSSHFATGSDALKCLAPTRSTRNAGSRSLISHMPYGWRDNRWLPSPSTYCIGSVVMHAIAVDEPSLVIVDWDAHGFRRDTTSS